MGPLRHGSARTTAAMRRAIQHRQERLARLAARYDLTPKTIAKWKTRASVHDAPMGPNQPPSTVLTTAEEALIVTCRRPTLLPLEDCLSAWHATIPHLSRSALHRCCKRHGISRWPAIAGNKPQQKTCTRYPIGSFQIDIAEVRTEAGQRSLFVASDRPGKFADAELPAEANTMVAAQFLWNLIATVPYKIHTVLPDNGSQCTNRKRDVYALHHICDRVCQEHGIDHRLTKTNHPWTNGQVERMNRTSKAAPVKKDYDQTHQHVKEHLQAFLMADNFAKRLTRLKGLTPYEYICQCWPQEPERLTMNPYHHTLGLNR